MSFDTKIEISARHIHLSSEHLKKLFGENHKLNKLKELSQPGLFAAKERVVCQFAGGRRLENVRIIGPTRKDTQVEISKTDAYNLGINPPVRRSGDLSESEKCRLIGPKGYADLEEGVIIAQRHLHIDDLTAQKYNIKDGQLLLLKIDSDEKLRTIYEVLARVSPDFSLACHLDVDEGNAARITKIGIGEIFI